VSNRTQFTIVLFFALFLFGSCRASAPENWNDAINLMTRYYQLGQHDDAIRVAQDWLDKHPEDTMHGAIFYGQIAITYLKKASKDTAHKDEWIRQGVVYYEKVLSVHQKKGGFNAMLFEVGRGFEAAGDLSTNSSCLYLGRAVKAFEEEMPFIQGDSFTENGQTIPLAPVRKEIQKALERVKAKLAKAGCSR
jgi:hypothetical protein